MSMKHQSGLRLSGSKIRLIIKMYLKRFPKDAAHLAETPEVVQEWAEELWSVRQITEDDIIQAILKKDWTKNKK